MTKRGGYVVVKPQTDGTRLWLTLSHSPDDDPPLATWVWERDGTDAFRCVRREDAEAVIVLLGARGLGARVVAYEWD